VVGGTPQEARLAEAASICGNAAPRPVAVRTDTEARGALQQQQADAYIADSATAAYDRVRSAGVMTVGDRFAHTQLAMGMRTGGTPLTEAITRDFYLIHSDGTYELLLQKWGMAAQTL
jgi:polar amino acid transport system substrate-binding protein